jgi:hypothetical protein
MSANTSMYVLQQEIWLDNNPSCPEIQAVFHSVRKPNYDGVTNLGFHLGDHDHAGAIMRYSLQCSLQLTKRYYQKQIVHKHTFGF